MGGNTFYLNYHPKRSGFKSAAEELLKQGSLVYCGDSAGAAVAGITIHGIEYLDDPKPAPEIVWEGLGLVASGVVSHWDWEKYDEYLRKAKQEMDKHSGVTTIRNDQILVIDGDKLERVTATEQPQK